MVFLGVFIGVCVLNMIFVCLLGFSGVGRKNFKVCVLVILIGGVVF